MRAVRLLLCPRCARPSVIGWRQCSKVATSPLSEYATGTAETVTEANEPGTDAAESDSLNDSALPQMTIDETGEFSVKDITRALWEGERDRFNKTFENGRTHVTSVNTISDERSIVRLSMPSVNRVPRMKKLSSLPSESLAGLKGVLSDCKQPPKVLQHNADQMGNYLANRNFPATSQEIREARRIVIDEIMENDVDFQHHLKNPKSKPGIEKLLYKKAQKQLSTMQYNWKPLNLESREEVAAFALSRLAPYFAEMERIFTEFNRIRFIPETVLDFGSGIGSAFWAAHMRWGERIRHYCLVDKNYHMRNFCMDVMRGTNYSGNGEFVNKNVYFRKDLVGSAQNTYDLVILHRTLIEMPSRQERLALIEELWKRTNKYLVIVETPLTDGFKAIIEARDFILTGSNEFDFESAKEALDQEAKLNMELIHFLANKCISDYEKLCVVREKLGENFHVPTKVERGYVYAPCPHDQGCPKMAKWVDEIKPCAFHVRWSERRADHKTQSYMKDGTLTGKFSYVILAKGDRPPPSTSPDGTVLEHLPRILKRTAGNGCTTCVVCTENDGIQRFYVSKRSKDVFKRVIQTHESQLLPVHYRLVKSSSGVTEMINELIEGKDTEV